MKKITITLLIIILCVSNLFAQNITIDLQSGIGNYRMSSMEKFNTSITLPFATKVVSNFPSRSYIKPSLYFSFNNHAVGATYSFQSTGSRISRVDYSGNYNIDMIVNAHSIGLLYKGRLAKQKWVDINLKSEIGVVLSDLTIKENLSISSQQLINSNEKFNSFNYYIQPGLNVSRSIKRFVIGLDIAYYLQVGSIGFHHAESRHTKLVNPDSDEEVYPNWSGFRLGISVGARLF
jgi:hypothetical protein